MSEVNSAHTVLGGEEPSVNPPWERSSALNVSGSWVPNNDVHGVGGGQLLVDGNPRPEQSGDAVYLFSRSSALRFPLFSFRVPSR